MASRRYIAFCLGMGMLTTGCSLGPKYVRPELADLPGYVSTDAVDTLSLSRLPWQQVFDDPLLEALIDSALIYNTDLGQAAERVHRQQALVRGARAEYYPTVGFDVHAQQDQTNPGGHANDWGREIGVRGLLQWEVDLWGRVRHANTQAKAQLVSTEMSRNAAQVSLIGQIATEYYNLLSLDNELRIVRHTLEARQETERLTKLRFEGGLTSETPYRQSQVESQQTAARVPALERDIRLSENRLSLLCGRFPGKIERASALVNIGLPDTIPGGTPSQLLEARPDIIAAEADLRAAVAAAGVSYTLRFPRLALTATGGLQTDELSHFLQSPASFLGAAVFGPIFDGGRLRAEYRAAMAECRRCEIAYRQAVLEAFREVADAIAAWQHAQSQYEAALKLDESSHIALALVRKQYIAGSVSFLDLLDAQRNYLVSQLQLSNSIADKQRARIDLYRALGGGW